MRCTRKSDEVTYLIKAAQPAWTARRSCILCVEGTSCRACVLNIIAQRCKDIVQNAVPHGLTHMTLTEQSWIMQVLSQAVGPEHDETMEGAKFSNLLILRAGYTLRGILQHERTPPSAWHVVGMP